MPFIAPFIASVSAAISAISIGTIITQAVIGIALGFAANYLMSKLMPKPDSSSTQPGGVQFERQYGNDVSRTVACGVVGIAGHDIYVNTYDNSNKQLSQVYELSDFYSTRMTRIAINGAYCTVDIGFPFGPGSVATVTSGDENGLIKFRFYDGRQSSADSSLVATSNPSGRWTATEIGTGVSYIVADVTFDQDKLASFPDFFFEFEAAPLYDPRKDDTAGGSGSHRWNNVATWEFSENPILMAYNYRRGFTVAGDMFCGMGMPAADLPLDKWIAAMNICDEIETDGKPRYRCSVIFDCMSTHGDNLKTTSSSCAAMDVDSVEGAWPLVGSAQPSVMTITDDDIVRQANNFKYRQYRSMGELVNSVRGNYPEPDQLWSMIGYDPQISSSYVTLDRRSRDLSVDFPQVRSARQAANLASLYLAENRYEASATMCLRPRFQTLEVGDWITWNSARYQFSKEFIVTGKSLMAIDSDLPRHPLLTLQERDSSIYDTYSPPPPTFPIGSGDPVYLAELENFVLIPVVVTGANGTSRPAIRASWLPIEDVTVTQIEFIYYPTDQGPTAAIYATVNADRTVRNLSDGVVGNTEYTVRARIITDPSRVTVFNAGETVTTLNVGTGLFDLDASIQHQLTTVFDQFAEDMTNFAAQVNGLLANQDSRNWLDKKMLRQQLYATAGTAKAAIEELQLVVADNEIAFADYQVTVSAQFGSINAVVTTHTSAIATLNGYAGAQYGVTLDINGYCVGFNLFNGGSGTSAAVFTVDNFKVAFPDVAGGSPVDVWAIGNVGGSPKIGIRGDMFIDGQITGTMIQAGGIQTNNLAAGAVTAVKIQTGAITSASGVIGNLGVDSFSIADNAVTVPSVQTVGSSISIGAGGTNFLISNLGINTAGLSGKPITVYAHVTYKFTVGGALPGTETTFWRLYINGTLVDGFTLEMAASQTLIGSMAGALTLTATGGVMNVPIVVQGIAGGGADVVTSGCLYSIGAKR